MKIRRMLQCIALFVLPLELTSCGAYVAQDESMESLSQSEESETETMTLSETQSEASIPSSVISNYRKYDATYSEDEFEVRKLSSLKDRKDDFIMGADISLYSAILESGAKYYDDQYQEESICKILGDCGINTVRIRLFHDYTSSSGTPCGRLDLNRVLSMIKEAKEYGLKVILDLHYSDTWADPGHQIVPDAWKDDTYEELLLDIYDYTSDVLNAIKKENITLDYIQIGNETDYGMVKPFGDMNWDERDESFDRLAEIMQQGSKATRKIFPECKIIIHTANGLYNWQDPDDEDNFNSCEVFYYEELVKRGLDFDICGASFYAEYMKETNTKMERISDLIDEYKDKVNKPVMIAETSYGYTFEWNDYTSNTFYTDDLLEGYPATFQGQTDFITDLIDEIASARDENGIGICYWGAEMIPNTDPNMRTSWANQALFTYEGIATPTLKLFSECFPK